MLGRLAGGVKRVAASRQSTLLSRKPAGAHKTLAVPSLTSRRVSAPIAVSKATVRSYANLPSSLRQLSENFLNGTNAAYVEEMFEAWKRDPSSVHLSWATFFKNLEAGAAPGEGWVMPPTLGTSPHFMAAPTQQSAQQQAQSFAGGDKLLEDHLKVQLLIRAYQFRGHELADLDPLKINNLSKPVELELSTYGFTEADLDREFFTYAAGLHTGLLAGKTRRTLREIISILDRAYCGTIGVEYMHIRNRERANWIRKRLELDVTPEPSKEERLLILDRLVWATKFESFLKSKWGSTKRYETPIFQLWPIPPRFRTHKHTALFLVAFSFSLFLQSHLHLCGLHSIPRNVVNQDLFLLK